MLYCVCGQKPSRYATTTGVVLLFDNVPLAEERKKSIKYWFVNIVAPVMLKEQAEEGDPRKGAVLDWRDHHNQKLISIQNIPESEGRLFQYWINADAKNDSLNTNPNTDLSWEIHRGDMSKQPFPGAHRTPKYDDRVSISGFK